MRFVTQGEKIGKFQATCRPREVLAAVDRMFHGLGLSFNKRGRVSGQLRHSLAAACAIPITGTARKRGGKAEFVVDLSWHGRMTGVAILGSICLFPIGLALALVLFWMAQRDVKQIVGEALEDLADDLAAD